MSKNTKLHYGFQEKVNQLNRIYKNQPTTTPLQIGSNIYRFSNQKFANKDMLSASYKKITAPNNVQQTKNRHIKTSIPQSPLTQVLQNKQYKLLYEVYLSMKKKHQKQKHQIQKEIKQIDDRIQIQQERYGDTITKLVQTEESVQELKEEYYQIRRKNLELRCELDVLRGQDQYMQDDSEDYGQVQQGDSFSLDIDQMGYQQILMLQERMGTANVGLSIDKIRKLTQKRFKQIKNIEGVESLNPQENEEVNCCICCQSISGQEIVTKLKCNHVHHFECLSKWLKLKRFCPLCKSQIKVQ